eukprot:CAMPEP_0174758376 /NCGR_PEP_ID=MMETSP1094-20130205/107735_1 /TAXON_ID=156173 /ORGANISM="Chrysochromulina brevifilum, Strain UTEX LB 985" /LENGTH=119 /DNA_ID=CAMNT_0015964305 /DNA_START=98 /DNA_END=457 /DNA_ORIENTATION=+
MMDVRTGAAKQLLLQHHLRMHPRDRPRTCLTHAHTRHRHAEISAKSGPSAPAHRVNNVLAASFAVCTMHMQRLALPTAAPADWQACVCGMLHASEVPYWHLGEVTSRSSCRPPAASEHK